MRGTSHHNAGGSGGGDDIDTVGRLFLALSDHTRRRILRCLSEEDGHLTLAELVAEVNSARQTHEQLRTAFWHVHLPRLERCNLVQLNQTENTVALTDRGEVAVTLADFAKDEVEAQSA